MVRPRDLNNDSMWSSDGPCSCVPTPIAVAIASRVRSSAVGPKPPVATTTSARVAASRNDAASSSIRSPTVV